VSSSLESRLSDGELVQRSLVGDEDAFAEIIARYQRAAWLVAFGVTRHKEDAEDVAQEAFLVALRRLEECRNPDKFAGWFMTIVRNRALNLLRRERRRDAEPLPFQAPSLGPGPDAEALRGALREQLLEALSELTPVQREVVLLHDVEGWKHREIADRTGLPAGTVRSHLHFARKRLRSLLESLDPRSPEGGPS
jgi:RNA polymerase sigma-70 factor, ECF subfamily